MTKTRFLIYTGVASVLGSVLFEFFLKPKIKEFLDAHNYTT